MKKLMERGLIQKTENPNAKSTLYRISIKSISKPLKEIHPERRSPCTRFTPTPERDSGVPLNDVHPNHHTNHQLESERKNTKKKKPPVDCPDDVDETVWDDFLNHRKTKKAPVTVTVMNTIRKQADKAGWSMDDALAEICSRGWTGFRADWVSNQTKGFNHAKTRGTGNGAKVIDGEGNVIDSAETHNGHDSGLSDYERKILNVRRDLGLEC